jgi:hypothetical protein
VSTAAAARIFAFSSVRATGVTAAFAEAVVELVDGWELLPPHPVRATAAQRARTRDRGDITCGAYKGRNCRVPGLTETKPDGLQRMATPRKYPTELLERAFGMNAGPLAKMGWFVR